MENKLIYSRLVSLILPFLGMTLLSTVYKKVILPVRH